MTQPISLPETTSAAHIQDCVDEILAKVSGAPAAG